MNILLVEPDFPYPNKSKNKANEVHKNFVPVGLLKIGNYHKSLGDKVVLVRGEKNKTELNNFKPKEILITSLFTYWSEYVWNTVAYYRNLFPKAKITIGGIYATLHYKNLEFKEQLKKFKAKVSVGLHPKAENSLPDYSLLYGECDYHLMHGMRGCIRRCDFCGTWKIEPKLMFKNADQITEEIIKVGKNKVIFLDNNFFANPYTKKILISLAKIRIKGKPVLIESQSGFDGRLLDKDPELAILLKKARFSNVRIAWDHGINDAVSIGRQLKHLEKAGFLLKDLSVFMIYNFDISLEDMIKKQKWCLKWGVQISDCRFRPLTALHDNYKSSAWRTGQTKVDYYIHEEGGWTDRKIRLFRAIIRIHNIIIRYSKDKNRNFDKQFGLYWKIKDPDKCLEFIQSRIGYSKKMEKWSAIHNMFKSFGLDRPPEMKKIEKNKMLQENIKIMNRAKSILIKKRINLPKFKVGTSLSIIKKELTEIINESENNK